MIDPIEIKLPALYPAQHAALYADARYIVVEGSTKSGKTQGCIIWQMGHVFGSVGVHWWIAPVYAQAKIAFRRVLKLLPRAAVARSAETTLEIELVNGSFWQFKSAEKPDNLYGEDVLSIVFDEASRAREEAFTAARSTLTATGGPMCLIGNVRGRHNFHFHLARKAQAGEPGYHFARLTAYDAVAGGVISLAEVEDAKAIYPDHVFRELYLCEPSDDGGNPFGLEAIDQCVGPLSTSPAVVFGVDYARVHDWSVVIGLDRSGNVCHYERFRAAPAQTIARVAGVIGNTPGFFDATGPGDFLVEGFARGGAPNLEPRVYTNANKQQMMESLAVALQSRMLGIIDGPLRRELESFEYKFNASTRRITFNAPPGSYDDCVNALALAWAAGCQHYAMHVHRGPSPSVPAVARSVGGRAVRI